MWIYLVLGGLLIIVGVVFAGGALLPREHVATRASVLNHPVDDVWKVLVDVQATPSWRTGVQSVEPLADEAGHRAWVEKSRQGSIKMIEEQATPPATLVTRIADESLPYGGTWTFQLESLGPTSCRVRITEQGFVKPPPFRFLARFVFGYTSTMEQYLRDLARKFGQDARIES